jgi:hypothetical protein
MSTNSVKLADLSDDVQSFLGQANEEGGILVEDDEGNPCFSVAGFRRPTPEQRRKALEELAEIQRNVRLQMEADGRTEEELDRIIQEDE